MGRVRAQEFETRGSTETYLRNRLRAALFHSQKVLDSLTLVDLAQPRYSARHEAEFTAGWALLHALEHTAVHTGHIQLMRQLWEQKSG